MALDNTQQTSSHALDSTSRDTFLQTLGAAVGGGVSILATGVLDVGKHTPVIAPLCSALERISNHFKEQNRRRGRLMELHDRCTLLTTWVIIRYGNDTSRPPITPLRDCVHDLEKLVFGYRKLGTWRVKLWNFNGKDVDQLGRRLDSLVADMHFAVTVDQVRLMAEQTVQQNQGLPAKNNGDKMKVVPGVPPRKAWHVARPGLVDSICEALHQSGDTKVVGLVGQGGSGKTTAAAMIVRDRRVNESFADRIVWLSVDQGAINSLDSLIALLASKLHEQDIAPIDDPILDSESVVECVQTIQKHINGGRGGKGRRCLLVADNVWEPAVLQMLAQTGMTVLVTTRVEQIVVDMEGIVVPVCRMRREEARELLRGAAGLADGVPLPAVGDKLIDLCGGLALDLEFIGCWSDVHERGDESGWERAQGKLYEKMKSFNTGDGDNGADKLTAEARRQAVLQVGFDDRNSGDNANVRALFIALAVMPDGCDFTAAQAAVLLYDHSCTADDVEAVLRLLQSLERWTILSLSAGGRYRMHDTHIQFARQMFSENFEQKTREEVLYRWKVYLCSREALELVDTRDLVKMWNALANVGGAHWRSQEPYLEFLALDEEPFGSLGCSVLGFFEAESAWDKVRDVLQWAHKSESGRDMVDSLRLAGIDIAIMRNERKAGNHTAASKARDEAAAILDKAATGPHCVPAEDRGLLWLQNIFNFNVCIDRPAEAKAQLRSLVDIVTETGGRQATATILLQCGRMMQDEVSPCEAEELLYQALHIRQEELGPGHLDVAEALYWVGRGRRMAGRLKEADTMLRQAMGIRGAAALPDSWIRLELIKCLQTAARPREAETILHSLSDSREHWSGWTLLEGGICAMKAGQLQEAQEMLSRARVLLETFYGANSWSDGWALHFQGECTLRARRLEEGEALLRKALRVWQTHKHSGSRQEALTAHLLGMCLRNAGRLREGASMFLSAVSIWEARCGPNSKDEALTLHQLGMCLQELGRSEEATSHLQRATAILVVHPDGDYDLKLAGVLCELQAASSEEESGTE